MKLELQEIKNRGTSEERIVLKVNEDCDLKYFLIFNTKKINDEKISVLIKHPFWFISKEVKKGDLVVVYSKVGTSSFKVNEDKTTSHFYYRGSPSPLLVNGDLALIVEATTWKAETF